MTRSASGPRLREHYGKAFEKWPDNSDFAAGTPSLPAAQRHEAAEKALIRACREDPGKPEPVMMLAEYYARTSQLSHAEMVFARPSSRPHGHRALAAARGIQMAANQA